MKALTGIILGLILCTFQYTNSYAQLNNGFFFLGDHAMEKGQIDLQIENLFYFRNLEYKTNIDEGRTLFGYQFWPRIAYQIDESTRITGGGFFQKDFGAEGFYHSLPTLTLDYKTGRKRFRIGTLNGSVQHNLVEPMYDFERVIENRIENGFQFLWDREKFFMDAWIDWQMVAYPSGKDPERFLLGVIAEPKWIKSKSVQLSTPLAMTVFHQGGEIDTSGQPTLSLFNFDYAGKLILRPKNGVVDSIDAQAHFLYYEDISTQTVSFIDGLAQYISLAAYKKHWGLMLNYYDGHQFQSPIGEVLFQSVSFKNPNRYTRHYRTMVMARIFHERKLGKDLSFLLRVGYMRDLNQPSDNVIGEFYFRWKPAFTLRK